MPALVHFRQRPVTGQPLQEIAQVHIVSELPEELGLGRIFAGADLDQLGVVHKNKRRQVGTLFFESTAEPTQNRYRIVGLGVLAGVIGSRTVADDFVHQHQVAITPLPVCQDRFDLAGRQKLLEGFAAHRFERRIGIFTRHRQANDVLGADIAANVVEIGEIVAAGTEAGDLLEIIDHEGRRRIIGGERFLERAIRHGIFKVLRPLRQRLSQAADFRVDDLHIGFPGRHARQKIALQTRPSRS